MLKQNIDVLIQSNGISDENGQLRKKLIGFFDQQPTDVIASTEPPSTRLHRVDQPNVMFKRSILYFFAGSALIESIPIESQEPGTQVISFDGEKIVRHTPDFYFGESIYPSHSNASLEISFSSNNNNNNNNNNNGNNNG